MTETAYEPRVKTFEPSQYEQAALRAQEALSVAKHFKHHADVCKSLGDLYAAMSAEPEEALLASDFRYLQARCEAAQGTVRRYAHPCNPAVLGHLSTAIEQLKGAHATWTL